MNDFNLDNILRPNIKGLTPYSSARSEFKGKEGVFLDANENSYGSPLATNYNRYPDPLQLNLKEQLGKIKGLPTQNIFIGNGSDEAIDLLFRAFCNPGKDNVLIPSPTYGMYEVSAAINDVAIKKVPLNANFQLDIDAIVENIDTHTKLIFLCSPNNPTANSFLRDDIEVILNNFNGLVVIDEAYINFSKQQSFIKELTEYPNLVVLQTLSKAWGLAGLRLGMAFASEAIISVLNKIKPPYNINSVSQQFALDALINLTTVNNWIKETVSERDALAKHIEGLTFTEKVFPSDANFILVRIKDPKAVYNYLIQHKIIVRDRSKVELCEGCLRITIGTPAENKNLIEVLKQYK